MMQLPTIQGLIRRRLLVNFRVDPKIVQPLLPAPFKPKLHKGYAIAGICLIRLEQMRPLWVPAPIGLTSENAAHRIAVCWTDKHGEAREGVYIPRRDTDSLLNSMAGGRLFPGEQHRAHFQVHDDNHSVSLVAHSLDNCMSITVRGHIAESLPRTSVFSSLQEASDFFKLGSLGYSATDGGKHLDGIVLHTKQWEVMPFAVEEVTSSFFANTALFPKRSVQFDNALIMRNIEHRWEAAQPLCMR